MITITRSLARRLWAVFRRMGLHKQPTAATRAVTLSTSDDELVVVAVTNTAAVEYRQAGQYQPDQFILPVEFLADCAGRSDESVTIEHCDNGHTSVQWLDKCIPQLIEYPAIDPSKAMGFPVMPSDMAANEESLWLALTDAADTADDENTRYALGCVQLRGQEGSIAATDGRQLLIQSGFSFPWRDSLLVPASNLFGLGELAPVDRVSIGRTEDWVALALGNWTIQLRIDKVGRFPRIDDIAPEPQAASAVLQLSESDAQFLLASLPKLPTTDQAIGPVILDLNGQVKVRAKGPDSTRATELLLASSLSQGESGTWKINRKYLARAVGMGLRDVRFFDQSLPILCGDERRQYVCALLDLDKSDSAHTSATVIASNGDGTTALSKSTNQTRRKPMAQSTSDTAAVQTDRVKNAAVSPKKAQSSASPLDQLVALRDLLRDAAVQTNQVIRQLKQQRRQARIVESTLASLRQIQEAA